MSAAAAAAPTSSQPIEIAPPLLIGGGKKLYHVLNRPFEVPAHLELIQPVGYGAYGFVVSAKDLRTGKMVAIKKNSAVFQDLIDGKRIVRELFVLMHLRRHENILHILDVYLGSGQPPGTPPPPPAVPSSSTGPGHPPNVVRTSRQQFSSENDVYIVTDLLDTNLHHVLRSSSSHRMTSNHYQFFVYQLIRGLKYVHSAGVIHRDLKPANLLVNMNCDLRICDFGLARESTIAPDCAMTDYVVTRYYRPPELLLMCPTYTCAVDIWSAGCIVAEMVSKHRTPLFRGENHVQQLDLLLHFLRPGRDQLQFLGSTQAAEHVLRRVAALEKGWGAPPDLMNQIEDPMARDLVERMLVFDPDKRPTAASLLQHPYLAQLHDPTDEPDCPTPFTWRHEGADMTDELLRAEIRRAAESLQQ